MKSKLTLCSLLALSIAFTSCKNEAEAETESATTSTTPQQPLIVPRVQAIPSENYVQPNQQVTMPQMPTTTQMAPPSPAAPTKAGMNPPHGQPGHRCDIAVGAPLNSPATKATTAAPVPGKATYTTTTIPTPTSTAQPSGTPALLSTDAPAATAPGMNPPHGQPGHVCGTPVGSPLPKS
ncbi:MAG: hypothetical protein M0D53_11540 [Flavobacterium sp. JAD_PAG50586_2]|nr:MAG: hypothetical protein M0D53_11540 [Flavobacterium sp. JAD_PAG50586_2]